MDHKRPRHEYSDDSDGGCESKKQKTLPENTNDDNATESVLTPSNFGDETEPEPDQGQVYAAQAEATVQSIRRQFEEDMISAYNLPVSNGVWDCAFGTGTPTEDMSAMHIVPPHLGSGFMSVAFGLSCASELYSPRNGLCLNRVVKEALEAGALVIVPNMPNRPTRADVETWRRAKAREYKFRVTKPDMTPYPGQHYVTSLIEYLDGRRLRFEGDFRPRARYLHFLFHTTMLRRATGLADDYALMRLFMANRGKFNYKFWGVEEERWAYEIWRGPILTSNPRDPTNADNVRALLEMPYIGADKGYESEDDSSLGNTESSFIDVERSLYLD